MLRPPSPYHLRRMTMDDLTAVVAIDRLSFPTPARPGLYEHEVSENTLAHYQVLCQDNQIIGYAGYWLIGDEVHISTIAVHPEWRGCGLGELLLLNLLLLAYAHPANIVTLEVRHANSGAQQLYHKYQFEVVGRRRRYYRDTGEDALIMTAPPLDARYHQFLEQKKGLLWRRLSGED
ncbi:MAG: ribosomal protein S18-alanine N-acetyltransferase [Ardenticatenaceae bacterium]|nr:ribosomal protein S18-alanine N-acetyltransferase [Ardenticatenaceae bacterium]